MIFIAGKMNQYPTLNESGYLVFYRLVRIWCRFSNRLPELFQHYLDVFREIGNILINGFIHTFNARNLYLTYLTLVFLYCYTSIPSFEKFPTG